MKLSIPHITQGVYVIVGVLGLAVLAVMVSSVMARCAPAPTATAAHHDSAIAQASAEREAARVISDSIDKTVVRPAYAQHAAAREQLRTVLEANTLTPLNVDSLKAHLEVTAAAATRLDLTSEKTIGGLVALVAAKTAEASAADTLASRATSALSDERKDRARERWVYRAKIAGGVLAGIVAGVIAAAIAR